MEWFCFAWHVFYRLFEILIRLYAALINKKPFRWDFPAEWFE
jgi:hypothetical protein